MDQKTKLFVWILLANFLQNLLTSLQGPLYPPEAESKGLRPTTYGLVMSFFRIVLAIGSFLVGINAGKFNVRKLLVTGVILDGTSAVFFGILDYVQNYYWFTIGSFGIRGMEALGSIAIQFSVYSIIPFLEPDRVAMANGLAVTTDLLGVSAGPLIGTGLVTYLSFPAPFVVFGFVQVLIGILIACTEFSMVPNSGGSVTDDSLKTRQLGTFYCNILRRNPPLLIFVYACFASGVGPDFLMAILEPGMRGRFSLSKLQVGLTFFYTAILQLAAPLWGTLLDKTSFPKVFLGLSSLVMVTALMMIGPLPGIVPNYSLTIVGLIVFGLAQGACAVGSLASLRHMIKNLPSCTNIVQVSFISTVLVCGTSMGEAISAAIAGVLFENYGFSYASLFPTAVHLTLIVFLLVHAVHNGMSDHIILPETGPLLESKI